VRTTAAIVVPARAGIRLELIATNRVIDLYEDDIELALRAGTAIYEKDGMVIKSIWPAPQKLVASPN